MYKVDNAVIMAAGASSRFAPLSYEKPKSLITVKGEVLIERQIRQLQEAGIEDIVIVTGYKSEQFEYLKQKFNVKLVQNDSYLSRNNNGSIYAVKDMLRNTYVCCSDEYFSVNPFENQVEDSYYAALYTDEKTSEWCVQCDERGYITDVSIGGKNSWYMAGHTFWNEDFSREFIKILEPIYNAPETRSMYWEDIYARHLDTLKMKVRKYPQEQIHEFDSLGELRQFDSSYVKDTRSKIIKTITKTIDCEESDIVNIVTYKNGNNAAAGFTFYVDGSHFQYGYKEQKVWEI